MDQGPPFQIKEAPSVLFTATDMSEKHVVTFVSFPNLRIAGGNLSLLSPLWVTPRDMAQGKDSVCPWGMGVHLPPSALPLNNKLPSPSLAVCCLLWVLGPLPDSQLPLGAPLLSPLLPSLSLLLPLSVAVSSSRLALSCAARVLRVGGGRSLEDSPFFSWRLGAWPWRDPRPPYFPYLLH